MNQTLSFFSSFALCLCCIFFSFSLHLSHAHNKCALNNKDKLHHTQDPLHTLLLHCTETREIGITSTHWNASLSAHTHTHSTRKKYSPFLMHTTVHTALEHLLTLPLLLDHTQRIILPVQYSHTVPSLSLHHAAQNASALFLHPHHIFTVHPFLFSFREFFTQQSLSQFLKYPHRDRTYSDSQLNNSISAAYSAAAYEDKGHALSTLIAQCPSRLLYNAAPYDTCTLTEAAAKLRFVFRGK